MDKKQLHDLLMAQKPDGAVHETCELCHQSNVNGKPEGGTHVSKTYTEDELQAAVDKATAGLAAQVAQLQSAFQESEVDAAVSAIKAEAEAKIEALQSTLDDAVLVAEAARNELATFKAELEELAAAESAAAETEARRDQRLARIREVASFPEEHLTANADRYAAMSDEDFETRIAEWAALGPKAEGSTSIPRHTALTARSEDNQTSKGMDAVRGLMRAGLTGTNVRNL